jgi:subtilisin family serine protease
VTVINFLLLQHRLRPEGNSETMQTTVNVNEATEEQLIALLNLSPEKARAVIDNRPFQLVKELVDHLPELEWSGISSLELPKLDINSVDEAKIAEVIGSPITAHLIYVNRPYYFLMQLRHVDGIDGQSFGRLLSIFTVNPISYTDKLTGQTISLVPDPSKIVIKSDESESANTDQVLKSLRLKESTSSRKRRGSYRLVSAPETETATTVLDNLKKEPSILDFFPSFTDKQGCTRYFDLHYCVVQFFEDTPNAKQKKIIASLGLEIETSHRTPGLYTLRLSDTMTNPGRIFQKIAQLTGKAEVKFAEPAYLGFDDLDAAYERIVSSDDVSTFPWNLSAIHVPETWNQIGYGKENVIVAVIDSGVDVNHPAISNSILPRSLSDDWNLESDNSQEPDDIKGHGTFIAGLLVGNGSQNIFGICPGCRLLPIKVPIDATIDSYARRRDGILLAMKYLSADNPLIINISWKTQGDVALIRDAIATVIAQGVTVVASAGNWPDQPDQPHYPSDYPSVISVGAASILGSAGAIERADYSFYGKRVNISAPGGNENDNPGLRSTSPGGGTRTDFGTSFSAPHVAGVTALIFSSNSVLTSSEAQRCIENTATPLPGQGLGYGLINAVAAVAAANSIGSAGNGAITSTKVTPRDQSGEDGLYILNTQSNDIIISTFDLAKITARIIIAQRPFAHIEAVRGILGMTEQQYQNIVSYPATL